MKRKSVIYWVDFESWRVEVPEEGGKDAAYQVVLEQLSKGVFPEIICIEVDMRINLRQVDFTWE